MVLRRAPTRGLDWVLAFVLQHLTLERRLQVDAGVVRDQQRPVEDVRQLVRDGLWVLGDARPQSLVVVPTKVLGELTSLDQERERFVLEAVELGPVTGVAEGDDAVGEVLQGSGYATGGAWSSRCHCGHASFEFFLNDATAPSTQAHLRHCVAAIRAPTQRQAC